MYVPKPSSSASLCCDCLSTARWLFDHCAVTALACYTLLPLLLLLLLLRFVVRVFYH
jgi:hypothetical protein